MAKERNEKDAPDTRLADQVKQAYASARELWASIQKENLPRLIGIILIVGVISAVFFGLYLERNSGMFPSDPAPTPLIRFIDAFYFSIVTMTTIGYGDFSPKTPAGKLLIIFVMFTGVICFSLLTATFASIRVVKMIREGKGVTDLSRLKGHTVICGWKRKMEGTLEDIFTVNKDIKASDIVIIANISQDAIDLFKQQNPDFKDINFIRGEDFNETMLQMANIKEARSAFILADESSDASPSEIDSKTVMTAMLIGTIARNIHVCAELLDPKFETYLQKAHVAEIIYPRQYGRLMLAHSTAATGLVQVMNDLLDLNTPSRLTTTEFPREFVGRPYSDLKAHYGPNITLIGLIENVGSFFERKQEALREAQKTANISKIVENLQKVKQLKNNHPHFNPPDDYAVPDHSMAIVVEVREEESSDD
jgi:voltage-gated potassium channel